MTAFALKNTRILFPSLINPRPSFNGDTQEYSFTLLIPKNDPQVKAFENAYKEEVTSSLGPKARVRPFLKPEDKLSVLKDGDLKYEEVEDKKKDLYAPYKGHYYINLKKPASKGEVKVVDEYKTPITTEEDIPHGATVNVVLDLSAYKHPNFGNQFSVKPVVVQVIDKSTAISGGVSPDGALELL